MKQSTNDQIPTGYTIASLLFKVLVVAFFAWMIISYIDIIADNSYRNPSHFDWNFFTVIMNLVK